MSSSQGPEGIPAPTQEDSKQNDPHVNIDKKEPVVLKKLFRRGDTVHLNDLYFKITAVGSKGISLVITKPPVVKKEEKSDESVGDDSSSKPEKDKLTEYHAKEPILLEKSILEMPAIEEKESPKFKVSDLNIVERGVRDEEEPATD